VLLTLHALRLKGLAELEVLASVWPRDPEELRAELDTAVASGDVIRRDGRMSGWALSAAGRERGERLLAEERGAIGAGPAIVSAYEEFLGLNQPFLDLCTDWQLRPGEAGPVLNDHTEAAYDGQVIDRLGDAHRELSGVLSRLAVALDRFDRYPPAFDAAWGRVREGDTDWFCRPMLASYHTVWFELHEDLLATLGRTRSEERQ